MRVSNGHPSGHPAGHPARQPSLREHNLALTLARIADAGPASRARLAAATGLTKATVASLVDTLIAAGLVAELGRDTAIGVGRPGSPVGLSATGPVGIGLEINVDYLATCTVDLGGTIRQRELVADDFRRTRLDVALGRASTALRRAVEGARSAGSPVAGIAVAVPGLVDNSTHTLRLAPNLGWRDVAVVDELRTRTATTLPPVTLDNEANLAALAELWCGGHSAPEGGPLRTFVHISGEIGVGAGLVIGGSLYRGVHGYSGEIGHLPVPTPTGARPVPCSCGSTGCLEQSAGQEAVLSAAGLRAAGPIAAGLTRDLTSGQPDRLGTSSGSPDGPVLALVEAANQGQPRAIDAIEGAGTALGAGICAVLNLLDVDTVVLGGLYARLAPWLAPAVERKIAAGTLAASWSPVRVLVSRLGGEAAVRGAAMSVVRGVIADPAGYLAHRDLAHR